MEDEGTPSVVVVVPDEFRWMDTPSKHRNWVETGGSGDRGQADDKQWAEGEIGREEGEEEG